MTIKVWDIVSKLNLRNPDSAYVSAFQAADQADLFTKYSITTPLRIANFLAQVLEESGGLTQLRENMNYSASRIMQIFGVNRHSAAVTQDEAKVLAMNPKALAERVYGLGNPRMAKMLGNTQPGDGFNFRGGGPLQTTGRAAYEQWGKRLGVDFGKNPDLIVDPQYIILPAFFEWQSKGCNDLADKNDIKAITKAINGGYNGYADRVSWFNKVWAIFNASSSTDVKASSLAQSDPAIEWVQQSLNTLGANPVVLVDGKWGPQSEKALRAYQIANKLTVDGIPGDAVKASIQSRLDVGSARSAPTAPTKPILTDIPRRVGAALIVAAPSSQKVLDQVQTVKGFGLDSPVIPYVLTGLTVLGIALFVAGILAKKQIESTPVTK